MRASAVVCAVFLASPSACGSGIDRSTALVTTPRILAVRAEPPESPPGGAVSYTALAATPAGSQSDVAIAWSFCTSPALAAEDSSVSSTCIQDTVDPAATGNDVSLTIPTDACRVFGPLGMPKQSGKPIVRPAAPDETGGYSQPVRLLWNESLTFVFERLTCGPTGVSLDVAQAFRDARRPNQNPQLLPMLNDMQGAPVDLNAVTPGTPISFSALWTAESAESYVSIDIEQVALVTQTEALWVAWFATGGTLERDFAIPQAGDTVATNLWQAPNQPGIYYVWTVLHDDRGGVDFAETTITVM